MARKRFTCPECRARFVASGTEAAEVACPSCGSVLPTEAEMPSPAAPKERRATKPRTPAWAWGVLALVVIASVAALWVGVLAIRKPEAPPPHPEARNDSQPVPPDPPPPGVTPPRQNFALQSDSAKMPAPRAAAPAELADVIYLLPDDTPSLS